jgi:ribonuclease R
MLPFELSTNICSLKPQVDRLVLSALIEFDHQGDPVSAQEFTPRRDPQRRAHDLHQRASAAGRRRRALRARYAPLVPRFELMRNWR